MKVLVVQDDTLVGLGMEQEIAEAGHCLIGPATSVPEAVRLAAEHSPDVALIDLDLRRNQDGAQLARELRAVLSVPSVLITYDEARARENASFSLGVVMKPYRPSDIRSVIDVAEALIGGGSPPPPAIPKSFHLPLELSG